MRTSALASAILAFAGLRASAQQPVPLRDLLTEAEKNSPEIQAAQREFDAATHVREQVTTLPDPQFTLQEFSVGSPRPGAGLSNSDFAYVGIGASQELPYPGKLQLKGDAADAAANQQQAQIEVARAKVKEQVKTAYVRLAYLQYTLTLLNASRSTLGEMIETQLARYSAGQGSQSEILKAQVERTKMLREITMHHEEMAQVQADLKRSLSRSQESPDIVAEELTESKAVQSSNDIVHAVERKNPTLAADNRMIAQRQSELASYRLAGKPDFSVGYMFERTGLDFPAYYMATFNVTFPRKRRIEAERAEAYDRIAAATLTRDARRQEVLAEARKQYAALESTREALKEFRDGILPQAEAVHDDALAALRLNKQTLDAVLGSFNDVLELKREYGQTLLDHELALIELETVSGEVLR